MRRWLHWLAIGCVAASGIGRAQAQQQTSYTFSFTPADAMGKFPETVAELQQLGYLETQVVAVKTSPSFTGSPGETVSFNYTFNGSVEQPQTGASAGAFFAYTYIGFESNPLNAISIAKVPAGDSQYQTSGHFSETITVPPGGKQIEFWFGALGNEQIPTPPKDADYNTSATFTVTDLTFTPAGSGGGPNGVPEIEPGTMVGALTLLTGGVLVLTDRRRRPAPAPGG